jgi:signal transduction histidine kinase
LTEERERRHIATDLHDHIGQCLAISQIKLKALREKVASSDFAQPFKEIQQLINQAIQYTRSLMFELSPPMLYELGLESAVEWLIEETGKRHGVATSFQDDKFPKPLDDEVRLVLFQGVRELLVNTSKHGQANNMQVSIQKDGHNIRIDVDDDGVGFDTSKTTSYEDKTGGFGLFWPI